MHCSQCNTDGLNYGQTLIIKNPTPIAINVAKNRSLAYAFIGFVNLTCYSCGYTKDIITTEFYIKVSDIARSKLDTIERFKFKIIKALAKGICNLHLNNSVSDVVLTLKSNIKTDFDEIIQKTEHFPNKINIKGLLAEL